MLSIGSQVSAYLIQLVRRQRILLLVMGILMLTAAVRIASPFVNSVQASAPVPKLPSPYTPGVVLVGVEPGMHLFRRDGRLISERQNGGEDRSLSSVFQSLGMLDAMALWPQTDAADVDSRLGSHQTTGEESALGSVYRVQLSSLNSVEAAVNALSQLPGVVFAEPDYLAWGVLAPDDPLYPQQWWVTETHLEQAWNYNTGAITVTIAIIDSGLDLTHVDFQNRLWINPGEISGNGLDDDNNGFVDDMNGWDFVNRGANLVDENGHGTEVAGVIGATGNNSQGIAGACWMCQLMIVKVMQPTGVVNYSHMAQGIIYAAEKGAHIINISAGGYAESRTLRAAIEQAARTSVIVAGAGNDNRSDQFYPAAYPQVLAVAAVDSNLSKASFSNSGSWIDLAAPGVDIHTTTAGGNWSVVSGTSLSAPLVSGIAALVKTAHPLWDSTLIRAHLRQTAIALQPDMGAGLVNAATALEPSWPDLSLKNYALNGKENGSPAPNSTTNLLVLQLYNGWSDAEGVVATLSSSNSQVTIQTAVANFGTIATDATASGGPFQFSLGDVGYETVLPFVLEVSSNSGVYTASLPFTLTTQQPVAQVNLPIAGQVTWSPDNIYLVTGDVPVNTGSTLTILPGTEVRFAQNASLQINGTLIADGTSEQQIHFIADQPKGTWKDIAFNDSAVDASTNIEPTGDGTYVNGSIIRHAEFVSAMQGITCSGASPFLAFLHAAKGGVRCTPGSTPLWIQDTAMSGGIYVTQGTLYARRNVLSGQGLVATGVGHVEDNQVTGAGISIGTGEMRKNVVVGGSLGLGSNTTASQNTIKGGGISAGSNAMIVENLVEGGGIAVGLNAVVMTNTVQFAPAAGLTTGPNVYASANRLIGNYLGIAATTGQVRQNLIAYSIGPALQVQGNTLQQTHILSNSFTANQGTAIIIGGISSLNLKIEGNNFENNYAPLDLDVRLPWNQLSYVVANHNWWGTTNLDTIEERVYHFNDNPALSRATFVNFLSKPDENAPAYVRSIDIGPADVLGIEKGDFTVHFSRPMDQSVYPPLTFATSRSRDWGYFTTAKGDLPSDAVRTAAVDLNGMVWFGTDAGATARINDQWRNLDTATSDLPTNTVNAIVADWDGSLWFGTTSGAARLNADIWTVYTATVPALQRTSNFTLTSGLPSNTILSLAVDLNGGKWFGTDAGAAWYDGANWLLYDTASSGLPDNRVQSIMPAWDGTLWFGTPQGAGQFDGLSWTVHTTANSPLPSDNIQAMTTGVDGAVWIGTDAGLARLQDGTWTVYSTTLPAGPLPGINVHALAIDPSQTIWVGTEAGLVSFDGVTWQQHPPSDNIPAGPILALAADPWSRKWIGLENQGISLLHDSPNYPINQESGWSDDHTYRTSFEFNYLILRDPYSITVGSGLGTDGLYSAENYDYNFTVDYAFAVVDFTPPQRPTIVGSNQGDSAIAVSMNATDPDSGVAGYRYAIGTVPDQRDVVGWTEVTNPRQSSASGDLSSGITINRANLRLIPGQTYFVQVQAQNPTGLWSQTSTSAPIQVPQAGTPTPSSTPTPLTTPTPTNTPSSTPGTPGAPTPTPLTTPTPTNTPASTPVTPGAPTHTPTVTPTSASKIYLPSVDK